MRFEFRISGYGIFLWVCTYSFETGDYRILQWGIVRGNRIWRGESHSTNDFGYHFARWKNGEQTEDISFRSPVVNRI